MQNKLTITKTGCLLCLITLISACNSVQKSGPANKEPAYHMYAIENNQQPGHWGYIIEYNHHLLIKQFTIPAIQGDVLFGNKMDAEKVGEFVTSKLNHSLHPSVSKKELDSLGIIPALHDEHTK